MATNASDFPYNTFEEWLLHPLPADATSAPPAFKYIVEHLHTLSPDEIVKGMEQALINGRLRYEMKKMQECLDKLEADLNAMREENRACRKRYDAA